MKTLVVVFLLGISALGPFRAFAMSDNRPFGLHLGFGVGHEWVTLSSADTISRFSGWAPAGEAGLDLPFTESFGLFIDGEYRWLDLTNSMTDTTKLEKATGSSLTGKAGLFWGPLAVGYGLGTDALRVRQVSAAGSPSAGVTETALSGTHTTLFASCNLASHSVFRFSLEGAYHQGTLGESKSQDASALLKFFILLSSSDR